MFLAVVQDVVGDVSMFKECMGDCVLVLLDCGKWRTGDVVDVVREEEPVGELTRSSGRSSNTVEVNGTRKVEKRLSHYVPLVGYPRNWGGGVE